MNEHEMERRLYNLRRVIFPKSSSFSLTAEEQ